MGQAPGIIKIRKLSTPPGLRRQGKGTAVTTKHSYSCRAIGTLQELWSSAEPRTLAQEGSGQQKTEPDASTTAHPRASVSRRTGSQTLYAGRVWWRADHDRDHAAHSCLRRGSPENDSGTTSASSLVAQTLCHLLLFSTMLNIIPTILNFVTSQKCNKSPPTNISLILFLPVVLYLLFGVGQGIWNKV